MKIFSKKEACRYVGISPYELDQYIKHWGLQYIRNGKRMLFPLSELKRFKNLPGQHEQVEYDPYGLIRPKKKAIVIELYQPNVTGYSSETFKSKVG